MDISELHNRSSEVWKQFADADPNETTLSELAFRVHGLSCLFGLDWLFEKSKSRLECSESCEKRIRRHPLSAEDYLAIQHSTRDARRRLVTTQGGFERGNSPTSRSDSLWFIRMLGSAALREPPLEKAVLNALAARDSKFFIRLGQTLDEFERHEKQRPSRLLTCKLELFLIANWAPPPTQTAGFPFPFPPLCLCTDNVISRLFRRFILHETNPSHRGSAALNKVITRKLRLRRAKNAPIRAVEFPNRNVVLC